ncbi:DUF1365 domain-containing protein [Silicimonas algicola]|nr:DUF1365 domain-containing protein [Silicimonas algicola]AZQ69613.1 DUF1365 domain-containing protein [Silicimonas algicola]
MLDHIQGHTTHARRGRVSNAFRYGVDYVLLEPEKAAATPIPFSRNRFNLWSVHDIRHGGPRGEGRAAAWAREVLAERGFPYPDARILLLTQPTFLGLHFNPISLWFALVEGVPRAVIAEVDNTFGHRHCYVCVRPGFEPIGYDDTLEAEKAMHVSPFQKVEGSYRFNIGLDDDAVRVRIDFRNGEDGVLATLSGSRRPATAASLLAAALRRPLGAARVVGLIHWQAIKLWAKRAPFSSAPPPPNDLVTDAHSLERRP